MLTNEGKRVNGFQRGDYITYPEPDGSWSVEYGDPDDAPSAPEIVASGLSMTAARMALKGTTEE